MTERKIDHGHIEKETARYMAAAHRVQTALAAMPDHQNMTPKHMRVGIDMSKADLGGLATLLIAKGVFTLEEYHTAIANSAEVEANAYENELSALIGLNITTI